MKIKLIAIIVVLVIAVLGFGFSANAQTTATQNSLTQQLIQLLQTLITQLQAQIQLLLGQQRQPVACTQEAKLCPDGSYVSRTGPNCEFATCPTTSQASCTETDGGANYYLRGTTTWHGPVGYYDARTDYCVDNNRVAEYNCEWIASEPAANYYTCPNGCENGACKQATTLQPWQIPGGKNVDDCIMYDLLGSQLNCYNKHCTKINPQLTKQLLIGKTIVNAGASGTWWKFTNENTVTITQGHSVDTPTIQPQYKTWNINNGQVIIQDSITFKNFNFFDCGGKVEGVAISSSPNGDLENRIYTE